MEIMNDSSIKWGSEAKIPTFDHKDLSAGKALISSDVEIDAAKAAAPVYGNTTPGVEISWDDLKGKEVAIKYTGDQPILCFSDKSYDNWTEIPAYTVDETNGIAYYLVDKQLPASWSGDLANVNHIQARTAAVTVIQKMVVLDAPETDIEVPVDKTKKTKIDFTNAKADDNLIIKIKGEPNTDTNGCVGFNGADGWTQVEWKGKTDANGNLTVEIAMSKFPSGIQSGEAQIWYQPELVDFDGYSFGKAEEVTTTTTTSATTTTSTTTTTSATTTTTVTETTTTSETTTTQKQDPPHTGGQAGDANKDDSVDMADVVLIMQSLANPNKYALDADASAYADVYGNDGVTTQDALAIQYFLLKKVAALPVPAGTVID